MREARAAIKAIKLLYKLLLSTRRSRRKEGEEGLEIARRKRFRSKREEKGMAMVKEKAMTTAGVRKGPWTEQEDMQLMCYVGLFGERRWDFIAKVSGLNRTGKSCRLRWVNYLHPGLKRGRLSPPEERLVLHLHSRWGNRWSRIARKLPGRTDNEIKNYWRTHMRKKAQERKRNSLSSSLPSPEEPPLETAGIERQHEMSPASGCSSLTTATTTAGLEEEGVKGYSMDQIWNEIASPDCKEDCDIPAACPPVPSWWEFHCCDSLWKVDDDELKMFAPMEGGDFLVPGYQAGGEPYG